MIEHIKKSHNKTLLLYHVVCPVRFRAEVLTEDVSKTLKEVCVEISSRYEMEFIEIGADKDHVHFLIQSIPSQSVTNIVKIVKSIIAREVFLRHPEVKKELWGAKFWTSGYYANTVSEYKNAEAVKRYVKEQGNEYKQLYRGQLSFNLG